MNPCQESVYLLPLADQALSIRLKKFWLLVFSSSIRNPLTVQTSIHPDQIAILMDLFPAACEVAGIDIDHEIEGRSVPRSNVPAMFLGRFEMNP